MPPVFLVSVGGGSFADGDRRSPALQQALPRVVDAVAEIVAEQQHA